MFFFFGFCNCILALKASSGLLHGLTVKFMGSGGSGRFLQTPGAYSVCSSPRTFPTMSPSWNSTWMRPTGSSWRATCSRGPAMLSKHGTGEAIVNMNALNECVACSHLKTWNLSWFLSLFFNQYFFCRRWFSIQNSQLVYQKKLKVAGFAYWCFCVNAWPIERSLFGDLFSPAYC